MLFDCFISCLYKRVLKPFFGKKKIFFCKFSSSFRFSGWSVQTVLLLGLNACGSVVLMVKLHVRTRAVLPSADLVMAVRTGTLQVLKSHLFLSCRRTPPFSLTFCYFAWFSRVFLWVFVLFCLFLHIISIPGTYSIF